MAATITIAQSYNASGQLTNVSHSYTASLFETISETVADGVPLNAGITIDVSALSVLVFYSDKAVTITSQNGSQAGIVLVAGLPYIWTSDGYFTNKLTHDVTTLIVTNNSGSSAAFVAHILLDATP